jgi:ligand-binding sensor domain-containing protein
MKRIIGTILVIGLLLLSSCATPIPAPPPEWMVYNTDNSELPGNRLTPALAFDAQGNLWIGTRTKGLAKFDGENWTVYNKDNSGLPHNAIHALAFDAQGNLWIGTGVFYAYGGGGLARFDGVNWTVYNTANSGLPDDWVWSLAIDAQGNKWIGTNNGGLAAYREGGVILTGVKE